MPNPWDSIDLIRINLMKLVCLRAGSKLGQPNGSGEFKVFTSNAGRQDDDSIARLEPLLKKFLRRAALVTMCEENPQTGYLWGLFNRVSTTGLPNLASSYERSFLKNITKSEQRRAVDRLLEFTQNEQRNMRSWLKKQAEDAFRHVRLKYKSGEKSSNKRYEDKPGGKYSGGIGQKRTLSERLRQVDEARTLLRKSRDKQAAESRAKFTPAEVRNKRDEAAAQLDAFSIRSRGVPFASLDGKGRALLSASIAGMTAGDQAKFDHWYGEWRLWRDAGEIQKNRAYVPHNPENAKAGNCMELAYLYLKRNHVPFVSQVGLSTMPGQLVDNVHKGDHAFAIVGLHLAGKTHGFKYPQDIVTLTPKERLTMHDAWVIDPWINEFCTVADYKFRFQEKMADWSKKGKQIWVNGSWIDPDPHAKDWYWRTVAELDWVIYEYHHYDNEVFEAEERVAAAPQRPPMPRMPLF